MTASKRGASIAQRKYIFERIFKELKDTLNKKYSTQIARVDAMRNLKYRHGSSKGDEFTSDIKHTSSSEWYKKRLKIYSVPDIMKANVCLDKADINQHIEKSVELPDSWYRTEYDAGNYKLDSVMEPCMSRPKISITWTNEERDLKKAITKEKRNFKARRKTAMADYSELQLALMEANKLLDTLADRVMLMGSGEAESIVTDFTKQVKDI